MTLTIHSIEDQQRQLLVTVEVAEERVQSAMRRQAQKLSKEYRLPGFRPGKMPYPVVLRRFGEEAVRSQAVEEMSQVIFQEMLEEIKVEPYAQVSLEDIGLRPTTYKFKIPLWPSATLSEYRDFRRDVTPIEVSEDAVNEAMEHLRTHHEVIEPVDRPVQVGDFVSFSERLTTVNEAGETEVLLENERQELVIDGEKIYPGTGFVEHIVGLSAGDETRFTFTYPADHDDPAMAGKAVTFEATILDVKIRTLPELNDEFAKLEGNFETLEELRHSVRENLQAQAKQQVNNDIFDAMLEYMTTKAQVTYPPAAVNRELDTMLERLKQEVSRAGWKWEDYLKLQNQTEQSLRDSWQERAEKTVVNGTLVNEFIKQEKLAVTDEDLMIEVEKQVANFSANDELRQMMLNYLLEGAGREQLRSEALMSKVFERVTAIANGNAPDLASLPDGAEQSDDEEE